MSPSPSRTGLRTDHIVLLLGACVVAYFAWRMMSGQNVVRSTEPMTIGVTNGTAYFHSNRSRYQTDDPTLVLYVNAARTNRALVTVRRSYKGHTPAYAYKILEIDPDPLSMAAWLERNLGDDVPTRRQPRAGLDPADSE